MSYEDMPPFQIWFVASWVALVGTGLGYSPSRAPLGFNAHTLILLVFLALLFFSVQLAYERGVERGIERCEE